MTLPDSASISTALSADSEGAQVVYRMTKPCAEAEKLLSVFYEELKQLQTQYPAYVRVRKI